MGRPTRTQVAILVRRAAGQCEYCHFPMAVSQLPFHCDHIVAEKHGGLTTDTNLAWACFRCNMRKGPNVAGLDPVSGTLARLFHPREDVWGEHFEWKAAWLRGKTSVGRTTVAVLAMNDAEVVAMRESLLAEGVELG